MLASENKIYYRNDSLILILDKKEQSEIIFLDLKSKICNYEILEQPFDYCEEVCRAVSYLFKSNLYSVRTCPWGLQFTVTDINNGTSLANFKTKEDEDLNFKIALS